VFETHINLWATLQTARGGLEVCDVILGEVQSSMTKRGEGGKEVIFSIKLGDVIYGRPHNGPPFGFYM